MPATARASVFGDFFNALKKGATAHAEASSGPGNLQTLALVHPAMNIDPSPAIGGGDITVVDDSALMPEEGPSGTIADIEKPKSGTIYTYVVREGDTVSSIAKTFEVTSGTILSANDLSAGSKLSVGQKLVILPITGIKHTVQKGDTLQALAKRYGGDATEIANYNGLDSGEALVVGTDIIIPNGEVSASVQSGTKGSGKATKPRGVTGPSSIFANNPREPAHNVGAPGTLAETNYYIAPLSNYKRTQGIHGYNAVDLAPLGDKHAPIVAAAAGDVVVARSGGWNGGYGSYVVISHSNGSQTLYSHMSEVDAYDGEHVEQGQVIGKVGTTGESTGAHVHFEIRDGIRNPF